MLTTCLITAYCVPPGCTTSTVKTKTKATPMKVAMKASGGRGRYPGRVMIHRSRMYCMSRLSRSPPHHTVWVRLLPPLHPSAYMLLSPFLLRHFFCLCRRALTLSDSYPDYAGGILLIQRGGQVPMLLRAHIPTLLPSSIVSFSHDTNRP